MPGTQEMGVLAGYGFSHTLALYCCQT